jgi:DNA-binding NarL/FixJ family response regulator
LAAGISKPTVLSSYTDDEYVRELVGAGGSGYLTKQTAANDLIKAVREAAKGNLFFCPSIAKRYHDLSRPVFSDVKQVMREAGMLTGRQREVLQLVAEGYPNKLVADMLRISIKTVEKHRQGAMDSLGIHDTAGLTRYAIAHGIVEARGASGLAAKRTA